MHTQVLQATKASIDVVSDPESSIFLQYSLVPRPRPAFRRFQYGKSGRGPGIIYHVSDVWVERRVERT